MIVPMKKVSIVVMDKAKEPALERLRELGVVHLEKKTAASPALTRLLDRRTRVEMASSAITAFAPKKGRAEKAAPRFEGDLVERAAGLSERRKTLQDQLFGAEREKQRYEKWGDFEPGSFKYLAENGVEAYLYDVTLASYAGKTGETPVIVLGSDKKNNSVRLLAFDKIPGENPWPLPEKSLSAINAEERTCRKELSGIEAELVSLAAFKGQIEEEKKQLSEAIEFETARAGMDTLDTLNPIDSGDSANTGSGDTGAVPAAVPAELAVSWISGYAPAQDVGILKRAAGENGWALYADDPAEDDMEVPTKLKNGKFASMIYPLTDFLEMSPGYRETDISGWFLLFFTLFFGMIFGDAGYGALLLLISFICIGKTAKKGVPLIFKFLLLMAVSNFLWGAMTCAWFGFDTAQAPRILQNVSLPLIVNVSEAPGWLESYAAGNFWIRSGLVAAEASVEAQSKSVNVHLMLFCFTIALVQLGIAHLKGILANMRSPRVLAELGQLGMLVGMYYVVLSLVVYNTGFEGVKPWQFYTLAGGFGLVFIFGNYEGNLLKAIGSSFANIITVVLGITNVFSDIMSYIRLWAVGLAGASIASTVDGFAGPMLSHFLFFVFGVALFVFGHGFNMVLNVLSVLVHGVRLNTLEFSTHIGLTWSGFAYKPFAKR